MIKYVKRALIPYPYKWFMVKYRTVFIHIPRTGGTSFQSIFMDNIFREHYSYQIYSYADSIKFNRFFKFAFVRNPYDRLISTFSYLSQGGNQRGDLYFQDLIASKYLTLERFVLKFLDNEKINEIALLKPQYLYIHDAKRNCMIDFIGRYERIQEDSEYILNKLKINKKLPHKNKSRKDTKLNEQLKNSEVKKKICELYNSDFELFNYSKGL